MGFCIHNRVDSSKNRKQNRTEQNRASHKKVNLLPMVEHPLGLRYCTRISIRYCEAHCLSTAHSTSVTVLVCHTLLILYLNQMGKISVNDSIPVNISKFYAHHIFDRRLVTKHNFLLTLGDSYCQRNDDTEDNSRAALSTTTTVVRRVTVSNKVNASKFTSNVQVLQKHWVSLSFYLSASGGIGGQVQPRQNRPQHTTHRFAL